MYLHLIKNGFHIHVIHALLQYITNNTYLSATICIKLYSLNYFYWYGHLYNYLPNKKLNWIKQFIRFTDTGHIVSFGYLFFPKILPLAHNVQFIISSGYWLGKVLFDMKDADRLGTTSSPDIVEWHMDICTYIHHTIPYVLIHMLWQEEIKHRQLICSYEYNNTTLLYTYAWLYIWFFFIYLPWRYHTGDPVYSILDKTQTPSIVIFGFIIIIHVILFLSNIIGYLSCEIFLHH
jgi:hypothetical protein